MLGWFSKKIVEILGWPSIRFLQAMLIGTKTWPPVAGCFALYGYSGNLKKSPPKVCSRFSNNFVEMFLLGWPSLRFLPAMVIGKTNKAARRQDCFASYGEKIKSYTYTLTILLNHHYLHQQKSINLGMCWIWVKSNYWLNPLGYCFETWNIC